MTLPEAIAKCANDCAADVIKDLPVHSCPTPAHRRAVEDLIRASYLSGISKACRVVMENIHTADEIDAAMPAAAERLNLEIRPDA